MSAKCMYDPSRGPGYGIVVIDGDAPRQNPEFSLFRASDGQCLSKNGWQSTECALVPDAWDDDTGNLRLAIGPSVIDHMDALDMYRIRLRGADGTYAHTLLVENIVYSPQYGGGGIAAPVTAPPITPITEPELEPEPEPESAPESIPVTAPETPPETLDMAPPAPKRSVLPLIMGLLLLIALAVGGYFGYTKIYAPAPVQESTPETATAPVQPSPEASAGQSPSPRLPMAAAREHLRSGGNGQSSLDLAKDLGKDTADPGVADAVFLLIEDAAQKEQAEAMYLLGAYYDPASTAPRGSIHPDMAQAYDWYTRALAAGYAQTKDALDTLKQAAEEAAAKGDRNAADLVRRWKF